MVRFAGFAWVAAVACLSLHCGGDDGPPPAEVSLEHCAFESVPATAGAGGTVTSGPLSAAAGEQVLNAPLGTALGAYTERAGFLGTTGTVDLREVPISGAFNPSIGIESAPRVKVVALSAGGETVVFVKLDVGLLYEGMLFDLEQRLGPDFAGKVMLTASHSHSAWGQQTGNSIYKVGLGEFRDLLYQRYLDQLTALVNDTLSQLRPAKIGIIADMQFDPDDNITRDRRGENNDLMGGPRKDDAFFMIRVDGADDVPIAAMPIYGVHGTLNDADNSFASTDSIGGVERWLEEQFDSEVVVMHLQGAGADTSPSGAGSINCDTRPGDPEDPCFQWLRSEGHGLVALPTLMTAYTNAGAAMQDTLELEMLTASIELGPYPETFTIRDGALSYAPFEVDREADREIFDSAGNIISPIDEFNAPIGAALCEEDFPIFPAGEMPNTTELPPYGSCVRLDTAADILGELLELSFESDATHPVCQNARTTISALRIGDYVVGSVPGELSVLLSDYVRERSPVAADKTIVLGYAQGHVGYCMTPEDWLAAGYESSINTWGPLEAEYIAEKLVALMPLATTADREDGAATGTDRLSAPIVMDDLPVDDPAPMAGTIPASVPERVWLRTGVTAAAQPQAQIARVTGHATFVFIGDDPKVQTPVVTLQFETAPGVFADVVRRSGRVVRDAELLLNWTALPLRREAGEPQTHYWAVEWQAVPWIGASDGVGPIDGLADRAALPLGNYRFRAQGKAFEIFSDPFEVVPANLAVIPAVNGNLIQIDLRLSAPRSYRLLDLAVASNGSVPVRTGDFTVSLMLQDGSLLTFSDRAVTPEGRLEVDAGANAPNVTDVTVTDRFGNVGTGTI